jgi:aspartate aminotransferase
MAKQNNIHLNLNVRGLGPSATLAINEKSQELQEEGRSVYRLGLGQSPFPVPERVVQALRENAHQKAYLPVKGL